MKRSYEDDILPKGEEPGWGRLLIILVLLALIVIAVFATGCAHRAPMVKTTVRGAGGITGRMGAAANDGATTTTETPFESETHKSFGRAAENLFAR